MSQAKISRIETGASPVDPQDIPELARALGASAEETRQLLALAERGRDGVLEWRPTSSGTAERQRQFALVEAATRELRVFQPAVVVGLLQTSEYARTILSQYLAISDQGSKPIVDVSETVSGRIRRQEVLADPGKQFRFVMGESVLRNRLCRPADMLAQLNRIREVGRQDNVTVTILPEDEPWPVPPYHGFEMLDEGCVLIDLFTTTMMSTTRSNIRRHRVVFDVFERRGTSDIEPILDRYFDLYLDLTRQGRTRPSAQA